MIPKLLAILALVAAPGCFTARICAGPTVDGEGNVGVEGGLTLGLVATHGERTAVPVVVDPSAGLAPDGYGVFNDSLGVDYVREPEESRGTGIRFGPRLTARIEFGDEKDEPGIGLGVAAAVFPRTRRWSSGGGGYENEKSDPIFDFHSTDWSNLGLEARFDYFPELAGGRAVQARLAVTWEFLSIMR